MAKRYIPSLICSTILIVLSLSLVHLAFNSDLTSTNKFLAKAAYLQLAILLLLIASASCLLTRNPVTIVSLSICFLCLLPLILVQLGGGQRSQEGERFSIGSFSAMTRTRNGEDIDRWLSQKAFDIACLQEVLPVDLQDLPASFYSTKPLSYPLVTLSKTPLKHIITNSHFQLTETTLDTRKVTVANVHMPRQYGNTVNFQKTYSQLREAIQSTTGGLVIVCGDFNMTPYNSLYTILKEQWLLRDAHNDAGSGLGLTFPNGARKLAQLGPQIRIDYVFFDGFIALSSQTVNISPESDHRAIEVVLQMRPEL